MPDAISSAIHFSLDGLASRQQATSNNLANIQTPGFLAKRTNFESSLRAALNTQGPSSLRNAHSVSLTPTRSDGNNVDLDNETITAVDTQLRYQAMIEVMSGRFRTLRTAIGG